MLRKGRHSQSPSRTDPCQVTAKLHKTASPHGTVPSLAPCVLLCRCPQAQGHPPRQHIPSPSLLSPEDTHTPASSSFSTSRVQTCISLAGSTSPLPDHALLLEQLLLGLRLEAKGVCSARTPARQKKASPLPPPRSARAKPRPTDGFTPGLPADPQPRCWPRALPVLFVTRSRGAAPAARSSQGFPRDAALGKGFGSHSTSGMGRAG